MDGQSQNQKSQGETPKKIYRIKIQKNPGYKSDKKELVSLFFQRAIQSQQQKQVWDLAPYLQIIKQAYV
jgi:hypothetical protein